MSKWVAKQHNPIVPSKDSRRIMKLSAFLNGMEHTTATHPYQEQIRLARSYWLGGLYANHQADPDQWIELYETPNPVTFHAVDPSAEIVDALDRLVGLDLENNPNELRFIGASLALSASHPLAAQFNQQPVTWWTDPSTGICQWIVGWSLDTSFLTPLIKARTDGLGLLWIRYATLGALRFAVEETKGIWNAEEGQA